MSEDFYATLYVKSLDGSMIELSGVPHQMKLSNFKQLVVMKINHKEKRNISANDLQLSIFGDTMDDNAKTLEDYGVREDAEITRIDHAVDIATERASAWNRGRKTTAGPSLEGGYLAGRDLHPPPYPGKVIENVFVQDSHRTYTLNKVPQGMTVDDFFHRLGTEKDMEMAPVMLMFGGKQLARDRGLTLQDYNIQEVC